MVASSGTEAYILATPNELKFIRMGDRDSSIIYLSCSYSCHYWHGIAHFEKFFFHTAVKRKIVEKVILSFRWPHLKVTHGLICNFKIQVQVYNRIGYLFLLLPNITLRTRYFSHTLSSLELVPQIHCIFYCQKIKHIR